ncbi:unnamed protein product, partial [Trichogramma brassicae]
RETPKKDFGKDSSPTTEVILGVGMAVCAAQPKWSVATVAATAKSKLVGRPGLCSHDRNSRERGIRAGMERRPDGHEIFRQAQDCSRRILKNVGGTTTTSFCYLIHTKFAIARCSLRIKDTSVVRCHDGWIDQRTIQEYVDHIQQDAPHRGLL